MFKQLTATLSEDMDDFGIAAHTLAPVETYSYQLPEITELMDHHQATHYTLLLNFGPAVNVPAVFASLNLAAESEVGFTCEYDLEAAEINPETETITIPARNLALA